MLFIGWTTVGTLEAAEKMASELVANRLAACVQVDGPITSYYRWEEKQERTQEYRLTIKFVSALSQEVGAWVHRNHPYETPEWVAVEANIVGEKYLSWARSNSTDQPL